MTAATTGRGWGRRLRRLRRVRRHRPAHSGDGGEDGGRDGEDGGRNGKDGGPCKLARGGGVKRPLDEMRAAASEVRLLGWVWLEIGFWLIH